MDRYRCFIFLDDTTKRIICSRKKVVKGHENGFSSTKPTMVPSNLARLCRIKEILF
jgi:hypothetical protein